jgi:retron-type reverse transcriptase
MPYITVAKEKKDRQLTWEEVIFGVTTTINNCAGTKNDTITHLREKTPLRLLGKIDIDGMIARLTAFNTKYANLIGVEDKNSLYYKFVIPKASGGVRRIDAPNDELKFALTELKFIFEHTFFAKHHTSAFAYVKGRCPLDAIKQHQSNNSRWFFKLDMSNFFGSITFQFALAQIEMIFPFNEVMSRYDGDEALQKALSLCFLNGGLPQGTPISPLLTNLIMIPIDHKILKLMRETSPSMCYTRYADDFLLSNVVSFNPKNVEETIKGCFHDFAAPLVVNEEKTRYGSSSGRNWNLGLMLNKDNEITVGAKRKKYFKAALHSLLLDYKNNIIWSAENAQILRGQIAYYLSIEGETIEKIIKEYSEKFGYDVYKILKDTISLQIESAA